MREGGDQLRWIFGDLAMEVAEIFANYISLVFQSFFFYLRVTVRKMLKIDGRSLARSEKPRDWTVRGLNHGKDRRV